MNHLTLDPIRRAVVLPVLMAIMTASPASAQERIDGRRVRVTVESPEFTGTKEGTLMRGETGRLTLVDAANRSITELPSKAIVKIEARGEHRATKRGLVVGLGLGSLLALLGNSIPDSPCLHYPENSGPIAAAYNRECDSQKRGKRLATLGVLLAPAAIGAGLGSLIRSETWSEVPVEHFTFGIRPERSGGSVGVHLSF